MDLFAEQAAIRLANSRRRRYARFAIVFGVAAALAFGVTAYQEVVLVPVTLSRSRNATASEIEAKLGPPTRSWSTGTFDCYPQYPCDVAKARGEVLFYYRVGVGYYAYFDTDGRLFDFDVNGS